MTTDKEIRNRVMDQILWDSRIRSTDIRVDVADGRVLLRGTVPSYISRSAAEQDAWQIKDVATVVNQLDIGYAPSIRPIPPDDELSALVRSRLLMDPDLDRSRIDVEVKESEVILKGEVATFWEKMNAERLAYGTYGVTVVRNELSVVPMADLSDEEIAKKIMDAMDRNSFADPGAITLIVVHGIAILSGTVPDRTNYNAAMDAVRFTEGIVDIEDNLTIQGASLESAKRARSIERS